MIELCVLCDEQEDSENDNRDRGHRCIKQDLPGERCLPNLPILQLGIAVNATIAAVSALLAAAAITRIRFGKPDASLSANGWVAGLVASSAGCAVIRPAEAMIIGLIAGALVVYSVELFELHLTIDDPGGSISVHAVAGLWGILATGWFARVPSGLDYPGNRPPNC